MPSIADRFRGFLPVALDVETGGFNPDSDALLEVAVCLVRMDDFGRLAPAETCSVQRCELLAGSAQLLLREQLLVAVGVRVVRAEASTERGGEIPLPPT